MDAITLLKADHRAVQALLKQVQDLSESAHAQRRELFQRIDKELTAHSKSRKRSFTLRSSKKLSPKTATTRRRRFLKPTKSMPT